ncbi:MAG: TolC family protein [Deltaproteobacteria bacterium]|nr:MAG: TolC family protein [Deltaproteobacteria bacterium]
MKFRPLSLSLILILCSPAYASLNKLTEELIENNFGIQEKDQQIFISKQNVQQFWAMRPWNLNIDASYRNDHSAFFTPVSNMNAVYQNYLAQFNKRLVWGGQFQVDATFIRTVRDDENFIYVFGKDQGEPKTFFNFKMGISYIQDLGRNVFGREEYKDLETREYAVSVSRASKDLEIESKVLEFFVAYIKVRQLKTVLISEKNALDRAKKRTNLIRRMVKDGLRLDVDLDESRMIEIEKEEAVKRAYINLGTTLERVSNLVHREVKEDEIKELDPFGKVLPLTLKSKGNPHNNKIIKLFEAQIRQLQLGLQYINYGFVPSIKLILDYKTDAIGTGEFEVLREGNLTGEFFDATAMVRLEWPLGYPEKDVEKAKAGIDLNTAKMRRNKEFRNIQNSEYYIRYRLKMLEENIVKAKKRWDLSKVVLDKYNKLYNLGRTDLLQSLTAEERRIFTELRYISYIGEREELLAQLAFLWGSLKDTISKI